MLNSGLCLGLVYIILYILYPLYNIIWILLNLTFKYGRFLKTQNSINKPLPLSGYQDVKVHPQLKLRQHILCGLCCHLLYQPDINIPLQVSHIPIPCTYTVTYHAHTQSHTMHIRSHIPCTYAVTYAIT